MRTAGAEDDYKRAVRAAVMRDHPGFAVASRVHPLGPGMDAMPHLEILELDPRDTGGAWDYVSCGAGLYVPDGGTPVEYMVRATSADYYAVELLTVIAYGHFTLGATGVVGGIAEVGGASVESGRLPWIYISPPYTLPAGSWRFSAGRIDAEIAWVIPITESEAGFYDARGAQALEIALEAAALFPDLRVRESVPLPDGF